MTTRSDYLLRSFVDRSREVRHFEGMLGGGPVRILAIQGPGGVGKSLLVDRMLDVCARRGIRPIRIEWDDSQRYNYLDIMRQVRDQTEISLFDLFTDRVNYYTKSEYELKINLTGGNIEHVKILEGGEIREAGVTIHVGHNIEITDSAISALRPDRDLQQDEVVIELTRTFMPCLRAVASQGPVCLFLDALEKADHLTLNWIVRHVLGAIRDQTILNLTAVISGRESVDLETSFFDCSEVCALKPFQLDDVLDYLEARAQVRDVKLATFVFSVANGDPRETATHVDNWIRFMRQQA